jgi:hypothetical protein
MYERRGRYYQRRYQLDSEGRERNVVEKEIHYVLGSGNHARTYLHQTASGELLPTAGRLVRRAGGFWAMNPGYDRPDHMDFPPEDRPGVLFLPQRLSPGRSRSNPGGT